MRNKKLIPFEVIEKAVAGSDRRGITALCRTYQIPVYLSWTHQRRYSRPFESTAYQSCPAISFRQVGSSYTIEGVSRLIWAHYSDDKDRCKGFYTPTLKNSVLLRNIANDISLYRYFYSILFHSGSSAALPCPKGGGKDRKGIDIRLNLYLIFL